MNPKTFSADNRPNLLIIITDQERAVMHFPEHWSEKHLPATTLLKKHGVEFLNGCCNSCMCSPSRSTLFSGVYPAQHGVTDTLTFGGKYSITEPTLAPGLSTLAQMLWADYEVHYRGKWHLSKGGMNTVHPEKSLMAAEVAQYAFRGWTPPDAGEDIALPNFGGGYANHDEKYIEEALSFIRQWKADKAEGKDRRPFALVLSLVNPHDVLSYPDTYQAGGYVDPKWTDGPIGLPNTVDEDLFHNWKPAAQWQLKAVSALGLGELRTNADKLAYINFYGNLMNKIDLQICQVLEEFYERDEDGKFGTPKDLAKETLIVRLSDHGEMGMAHGGMRQKAFNVYDETLKVPYIFSNPEVINPSGTALYTTQPAGLIDIVPTLAGLLQLEPPTYIKGHDLSAVVLNPGGDHPDLPESHLFTFDDVKSGNKNIPQTVNAADRIRCVRTKDWKYARYFDANGSYLEEYELYYIKGIEFSEVHQGDPNDPLDLALKGQPYEYVNLAYEENPLFQELPEAAKQIAREAHQRMKDLLKDREKDILTGTEIKIRQKVASAATATN